MGSRRGDAWHSTDDKRQKGGGSVMVTAAPGNFHSPTARSEPPPADWAPSGSSSRRNSVRRRVGDRSEVLRLESAANWWSLPMSLFVCAIPAFHRCLVALRPLHTGPTRTIALGRRASASFMHATGKRLTRLCHRDYPAVVPSCGVRLGNLNWQAANVSGPDHEWVLRRVNFERSAGLRRRGNAGRTNR